MEDSIQNNNFVPVPLPSTTLEFVSSSCCCCCCFCCRSSYLLDSRRGYTGLLDRESLYVSIEASRWFTTANRTFVLVSALGSEQIYKPGSILRIATKSCIYQFQQYNTLSFERSFTACFSLHLLDRTSDRLLSLGFLESFGLALTTSVRKLCFHHAPPARLSDCQRANLKKLKPSFC